MKLTGVPGENHRPNSSHWQIPSWDSDLGSALDHLAIRAGTNTTRQLEGISIYHFGADWFTSLNIGISECNIMCFRMIRAVPFKSVVGERNGR